MKSAGKARSNGLYRHIRTSKEIIRNLLNDCMQNINTSHKNKILQENTPYAIAEPIRIILAGIIYVDGMQYRQLTIIVTTPNFPAHLK